MVPISKMIGSCHRQRSRSADSVTQTSIAHLTREKLLQAPMPVPPLPQQRAIADALGDMDALDRLARLR